MSAIHRHWTTDEVRALIDESRAWPRYELIGGELLVTPAPASPHQTAVVEILSRLVVYLASQPIGRPFVSPADIELHPGSIAQPDAFVIPIGGVRPGEGAFEWRDVEKLMLAVEVISPSSIHTDRVDKRDYYLDANVPDYLVIDLDARTFEHWTGARYLQLSQHDTWTWHPTGATAPLTVHLPEFFETVAENARILRNFIDRRNRPS